MRGKAYDGGRRLSRRDALRASLLLAGTALVGCSGQQGQGRPDGDLLAWPADDRWPDRFWREPAEVREAYRFAAANPDVLRWMPCFCGCGEWGHTSNARCYEQQIRDDGSVLLDPMSYG